MTEQELLQVCLDLRKIGDSKEMMKALMAMPDEQREELIEYVINCKGSPWKTPVDQ